jgi:hypothetical protein
MHSWLMFDLEGAPISTLFIIILFKLFIVVNIEGASLVSEPVLDGFDGDLTVTLLLRRGCYPAIHF